MQNLLAFFAKYGATFDEDAQRALFAQLSRAEGMGAIDYALNYNRFTHELFITLYTTAPALALLASTDEPTELSAIITDPEARRMLEDMDDINALSYNVFRGNF